MCMEVCLQRRPPELSTLRKYRLISITIYRRYSQRGGGWGLPYFFTTLFFESATPRGLSRRRRLFDEDINGNYGHVSPRFQRAATRPPPCYWHAAAKSFFPRPALAGIGRRAAAVLSKHRGASLETMSSFSFLLLLSAAAAAAASGERRRAKSGLLHISFRSLKTQSNLGGLRRSAAVFHPGRTLAFPFGGRREIFDNLKFEFAFPPTYFHCSPGGLTFYWPKKQTNFSIHF